MTIEQQVLSLPLRSNVAVNIKLYLKELLATLWDEGESFSSKRPFGDSNWQYDIYTALVEAGLVRGSLDKDGYLEEFDVDQADTLIQRAIASL